MSNPMKVCTKCSVSKPESDFYMDSRFGIPRSCCRACLTNGRPPGPVPVDPLRRFVVEETGCWIWRNLDGSAVTRRYGSVKHNGKIRPAHVVVWEILKGPVGHGLELDHLCRVTHCVNPDHLEAVTHKVNMERGAHAQKSACAKGHAFDADNTFRRSGGGRGCRACLRAAQAAYKAKINDRCEIPVR